MTCAVNFDFTYLILIPCFLPFVFGSQVYLERGNSEYVAHACRKIRYFGEEKKLFVTTLDLIKSLKQIK